MKCWPRTTFGRTALLLAGVLLLANITAFAVIRSYLIRAGIEQLAAVIGAYAQTLSRVLEPMEPEARAALLATPPPGIRLRQDPPPGNPPQLYFFRELAQKLSARFNDEIEIRVQRNAEVIVWGKAPGLLELWIGVPFNSLAQYAPTFLLLVLLSIAGLTVIGAGLVVRQINLPLKRLVTAAHRLGREANAPVLEPEGPEEIQALARALNQTSAALAQLAEDRAFMLAGISHDLRSPLARLSVALELLAGDEELKTGIRDDITHIDAIIEQFTALARPEQAEPRWPGDLNELIRTVVAASERNGLTVQLQLAELPLTVFQPLALRRALTNLLENAHRYGRPPITIASAIESGAIVIRVQDGGDGVPESELERLLLPFVRLDAARATSGTGLGLAIAARIVAAHGGRIALRNRPCGGLEARVVLPVTQP
ncbi:MAG: HAMP domain-containing protein [Synechococcaceae cyanobacterium SM1_2_3]|nr:HAMP domain-containing protein [Synechococcaceae cyanobacterium SM1_2_3]